MPLFMANRLNVAFDSLDDDELFDLFRRSPSELSRNKSQSSAFFDDLIVNNVNSSSKDIYNDFDFEYDSPQIPSKYVTVDQFKDYTKSFSQSIFSMLHLNIRSINKHFDELQILLDNQNKQQISVIGLTETWLSFDVNLPYALNGYEFIVNNRVNRTGGGVAFYLSEKFEFNVCDELNVMNEIVETLFVEICIPQSKNIIIGIVYRPPSSSSKDFLNCMTNLLKSPLFINKSIFIMGDFNIDLIRNDDITSQEFLEMFLSASFLPLISKPTRVTNHSATLLDNIFSNSVQILNSAIILSDITDHFPIITCFDLKHLVNKFQFSSFRRRASPENLASLGACLDRADWSSVYDNDDVNASFEKFSGIMNKYLDEYIPKIKIS